MKILITGASGQLGLSFKKILPKSLQIIYCSKSDLDIVDYNQIEQIIINNNPDVIINCAAYTAVDQAELNPKQCFRINVLGVQNLAIICKSNNIKLVHISTDFVFDGEGQRPLIETDITNPINTYGKSKLNSEIEIISSGLADFLIIRTSWVFSEFGENFVKTMIRLGNTHKEINVINDQVGRPTYAPDLAKFVYLLITNSAQGIFHFANYTATSWYDFSIEIFKYAEENKLIDNKFLLSPVSSSFFKQTAKRPSLSVLDTKKISSFLNLEIKPWQEHLKQCIGELSKC